MLRFFGIVFLLLAGGCGGATSPTESPASSPVAAKQEDAKAVEYRKRVQAYFDEVGAFANLLTIHPKQTELNDRTKAIRDALVKIPDPPPSVKWSPKFIAATKLINAQVGLAQGWVAGWDLRRKFELQVIRAGEAPVNSAAEDRKVMAELESVSKEIKMIVKRFDPELNGG